MRRYHYRHIGARSTGQIHQYLARAVRLSKPLYEHLEPIIPARRSTAKYGWPPADSGSP